MPSSADIYPRFEELLRGLQAAALAEQQGMMTGQGPTWSTPSDKNGWDGNLSDIEGLAKPFERDELNAQFEELLSNAESTQGDGMLLQLMVDYMAVMERAFRARHAMPRVRCIAHAMARRRGHGLPYGVFGKCVLEYLRQIAASGKQ